jgi:GT2 family glycosyltransferase
MGDRAAELDRAIASAMAQRDAEVEVVVVGNGAGVPAPPDGVTVVGLPENVGVAAGRNAGAVAASGDVILFLDDDGWYRGPDTGRHVAERFATEPDLAVLSFRVVDPDGGPGARWHVPRLRAGDPERSSVVTTFAGGACAVRRSAFAAAGGLPEAFFYAHEETDLAWRLLGLGYRLEYDAAVVVCHHVQPNARHAGFHRLDGRNRVLIARRNLPWPLACAYLLDWFMVTVLRERSGMAVRAWARGFAEGWRMDPGERRPMSARTVWQMTRAGRPPVI